MLKSLLIASTMACLLVPAVAADALPDAKSFLTKDMALLRTDPALGEIWGNDRAPPEEPRYCVRDGRITCAIYGLGKAVLMENGSYHNFYGLDQDLPPVKAMQVLYDKGADAASGERFNIVLQFAP